MSFLMRTMSSVLVATLGRYCVAAQFTSAYVMLVESPMGLLTLRTFRLSLRGLAACFWTL